MKSQRRPALAQGLLALRLSSNAQSECCPRATQETSNPYRSMNPLPLSHSLTPVYAVEQKLFARYQQLPLEAPFIEFRTHVDQALAPWIDQPASWSPDCIEPSYFATKIAPHLVGSNALNKRWLRKQAELVDPLERGLACCRFARQPVPKPLVNLLAQASDFCNLFDAHVARHASQAQAGRACRARGGHERHRDHRYLVSQIPELLARLAPLEGWKNKTHAAETVGAHLCALGQEKRFSVSRFNETWERIVHRTIGRTGSSGHAADAFQSHRRAPRFSRCPHASSSAPPSAIHQVKGDVD